LTKPVPALDDVYVALLTGQKRLKRSNFEATILFTEEAAVGFDIESKHGSGMILVSRRQIERNGEIQAIEDVITDYFEALVEYKIGR
jgi:hypothetical protein